MFSKASVKKPLTVVVAIIVVIILGVVSYMNMSIDLIPSINMPYAIVYTQYPGASPEEVEMTVTKTVEQSMASLSDIEEITSTSSEHISIVMLKFNEEANMDTAMIEMRENLDMIENYFPDGVGSASIMKINPDMLPIMSIAVSVSDKEDFESVKFIQDQIIPKLDSVSGVASTSSQGLIENMVDITINEDKIEKFNHDLKDNIKETIKEEVQKAYEENIDAQLEKQKTMLLASGMNEDTADKTLAEQKKSILASYQGEIDKTVQTQFESMDIKDVEITKDMVSGILMGNNISLPAGSMLADDGTTLVVRVGDKIKTLDDLKNLTILSIKDFKDVTLSDLATFKEYDNTDEMYSKINGEHAVTISIEKQPDFSTADVSHNVLAKIEDIKELYPEATIEVLMDQGEYVDMMIGSIVSNLLSGAALAVLVLLIFLKKIRPTFIVGISILISVITAFVLMYYTGITLNMISMGGLALGVGMLVDNSIVVMENIVRMRNEGLSAKQSAILGAKEISGAITASTLTTVIVFVPVTFTTGITRQLFTDMALTITYSLLASLVVALTVVPSFYSMMMKNDGSKKRKVKQKITLFERFANSYGRALGKSLKHRWISIMLAIVLLATSVFVAFQSGTQLFPVMDSGSLTASITMPEGYTTEEKFEALDEINDTFLSVNDVETVGIIDGGTGVVMSMMQGGSTTVYLSLKEDREQTTNEIIEDIRQLTKEKEYEVTLSNSNMDMSMLTGNAVSIEIYGEDIDTLRELASQIGTIVQDTEGTKDISNGLENPSTELRITVDKDKAIEQGLTVAQVYSAVNEQLEEDSSIIKVTQEDVEYSVFVKEDSAKTLKEKDVTDIEILSPTTQKMIKVGDIAKISYDEGLSSIKRSGQKRFITITASLIDGYTAKDVNESIEEKVNDIDLPTGFTVNFGGENEAIEEAFADLYLMLALSIVFIYLVMVAQFQSLLSPFIVMFTIPLAFTGGFIALYITSMPISMISLIGMIILVGVVVNNGIVFVDYANQLMQKGLDKNEALVKAGVTRLRPILMTALTTIIAMVIMAFDSGSGAEMLQPMCITTIGGLSYSTILTLFVVPSMYSLFHKNKLKIENDDLLEETIEE